MWVEMAALRMTRRETGLVALRIVIGFVMVLGWSIDSRAQEDPLTALLAHPCTEPWDEPIAAEDLSAWAAARLKLDGKIEVYEGQWPARLFPDDGRERWVAMPPLETGRSFPAGPPRLVFRRDSQAFHFEGCVPFEPLFLTFLAPVARGGQPLATRIRIHDRELYSIVLGHDGTRFVLRDGYAINERGCRLGIVSVRDHYLCESDVMVTSGRILRLDVDLDGDTFPEIMLSNSQTTGNGGGGWLIYAPQPDGMYRLLGRLGLHLGFFRIDEEAGRLTAGSHRGAGGTGFATYRVDEDGFHRIDQWVWMVGSEEHAREARKIAEWQAASRGPLYHAEIESFAKDDDPLFFTGAAPAPELTSVVRAKLRVTGDR